ncbi:alpha/beta hydrolase [Glaciihabitans sp. dw_435]|uniref:alpha/beta hydrolase n=1 Tax=Glaciihabitans sp. dw_435 TaxID=2720081 RepID=UPI0021052791|nr:alpha/beta hydrolase [Glaciihabitans sp. dw_435]
MKRSLSPRARIIGVVVAALALIAAMVVPATASATTGTRHGSTPATTKPTIVLVHGAWADGTTWAAEVLALQKKGYTVLAGPNNLRGVADDAAYLRQFLTTISGPVVLVGHSYGGFVITNAATGLANVKALVYIDAFIPDEGQTVAGLTAGTGSALEPALADPTSVFTLRPYPGAPEGVADTYLLPEVVRNSFAQDLPAAAANLIAATQMPASSAVLGQPSAAPAWKDIPSWALVGTRDKIITPATQRAMAVNAGSTISTVKSSHVSLISHPATVTKLIITAANAVG